MKRRCDNADCPMKHTPVWGDGEQDDPLAIIIGEAPGVDEDAIGLPFVGKTGQELTMYLNRFSRVPRHRLWITNLVKCRPPRDKDPKQSVIRCCTTEHLIWELEEINCDLWVTLGRLPSSYILGRNISITKYHGILQETDDKLVLPLYHPAYGLHSSKRMQQVIEDFRVLGQVIRSREFQHHETSTSDAEYGTW